MLIHNCEMMTKIETTEGGQKRCLLMRGDHLKKTYLTAFKQYFKFAQKL